MLTGLLNKKLCGFHMRFAWVGEGLPEAGLLCTTAEEIMEELILMDMNVQESSGMDGTDETILDVLSHDGRATLMHLSKASGLSVSAVQSRVQKMEKRGVIKGYRAVVDQTLRGLPISAFVAVTPLDYSHEDRIPSQLETVEGVTACYSIAGAPSFMLVVRVASPEKLEELLNRIHRVVPASTESTMILQTYFEH